MGGGGPERRLGQVSRLAILEAWMGELEWQRSGGVVTEIYQSKEEVSETCKSSEALRDGENADISHGGRGAGNAQEPRLRPCRAGSAKTAHFC